MTVTLIPPDELARGLPTYGSAPQLDLCMFVLGSPFKLGKSWSGGQAPALQGREPRQWVDVLAVEIARNIPHFQLVSERLPLSPSSRDRQPRQAARRLPPQEPRDPGQVGDRHRVGPIHQSPRNAPPEAPRPVVLLGEPLFADVV